MFAVWQAPMDKGSGSQTHRKIWMKLEASAWNAEALGGRSNCPAHCGLF